MARYLYGGTAADVTTTQAGQLVTGATLTVWDSQTGGTQITDLQDATGAAATVVTSDAYGRVLFYAPDGENRALWLQGSGPRMLVRPAVSIMPSDSMGVFNVKDYGAAGDDSADDTAEIQAAITAAVAAAGTVLIPPGTYKISNTLSVTGQVTITGTGTIHMVTADKQGFHISGDDVTIDGLTLTGRNGGAPEPVVIGMANELAVYVKGASAAVPVHRFTARNLTISAWGWTAVYLYFVDTFVVEQCVITDTGYKGVNCVSCKSGKVLNNHIDTISDYEGNAYGVTFYSMNTWNLTTDPPCQDMLVSGNYIANVEAWEAIDCHGIVNLTISDNQIYNCPGGIDIGTGTGYAATGVTIVGNLIDGGVDDGSGRFAISIGGLDGIPTTAVVVGNKFRRCCNIGVHYTANVVISSNTFDQSYLYAINLFGDNNGFTVANNTFTDVWYGSAAGCAAIRISGDANVGSIHGNVLLRGSKTGYVNDGYGVLNYGATNTDLFYGLNHRFDQAVLGELHNSTGVNTVLNKASGVPLATLGPELGSGSGTTQALTGLTIGAKYHVSVIGSGTFWAATLDGASLYAGASDTMAFKATATSHTVVKTGGSCTDLSVKQVTDRSLGCVPLVSGMEVAKHNSNVFLGSDTRSVISANENVAIGTHAMGAVVDGTRNVAIGQAAQVSLIGGSGNIGIGYAAQLALKNGLGNTAVGDGSLLNVVNGAYNTAVGRGSLGAMTGADANTAVGNYALAAATGGSNTALGYYAGNAFTSGVCNLALGKNAGNSGTTGTISGTVCIGTSSAGVGAQATANNDFILGVAAHNVQVPGTLKVAGNVGFYGTTPVAKPTGVAVDAAGIHAALVTLGLIAA